MCCESGESFLKQLAEELVNDTDKREPLIILPGKRARLFLYQSWAGVAGKPVWAPEVLTMEEFVFDALELKAADDIDASLTLWEVCSDSDDKTISFEMFSGWAPIILRDFNEVDLFMADANQVFSNLLEAKELQMWVPGEQKTLSDFEINYIEFYAHLLSWYNALKEKLMRKGLAFQGMAFRMLAQNPAPVIQKCQNRKVIFAGFNAFTPSEEKIVNAMIAEGIGGLRWDADRYYLDNEDQEAGYFLRKWINAHPGADFRWVGDYLVTDKKHVSVYGVHGSRAQARLAGELLKEVQDTSGSVAIVLPDDTLLMPVLNSVPPEIKRFNVTMGLPFRQTPALSWFQLNLRLFVRHGQKNSPWIRVTDLIPVLRHPWFMLMVENDEQKIPAVPDPVAHLKTRFYNTGQLAEIFSETYPHAGELMIRYFSPVRDPAGFLDKIEDTLRTILVKESLYDKPFEQGALYESLRILTVIRDVIRPAEESDDPFNMLRFILSRLLQSATIPFTGEPMEGIQILGLLETRNIDFDRVILLSANEGVIPSGRKPPTLIPADIRKHHSLPGVQHQDAIFAYHFYHLLQRAKNIDIIYNTDLSSDFSGELSRFVRQIEAELLPQNPGIIYRHVKLSNEIHRESQDNSLSVDKSEAVYDILKNKLVTRGLSPSQLSKYVKCPLMFYFSFVAALEEEVEMEEALDFRELGNVVHESLRVIYDIEKNTPVSDNGDTNGEGFTPDRGFFARALAETDSIILEEMKKLIGGGGNVTGKNLIINEVAAFMIKGFLQKEQELIEEHSIKIKGIEQSLEKVLAITAGSENIAIKFIGKADRIDLFDGTLRLTDYKTGKVEPRELNFGSVGDIFADPKYEKALQLIFYCWLYAGVSPQMPVSSGIFTLRSPSGYYLGVKAFEQKSAEEAGILLKDFENGLKAVCSELLDRSIPFSQTDDTEICKKCSFCPVCLTGC